MKITAVILAGGAGTRLWPLSNEEKPKQFHDFDGKGSLLNATIKRLMPLNPDICIIATARKYKDMSRKELEAAGQYGIILSEPVPRNTAPAILYAAAYLSGLYDDALMIVLPADHYIKRNDIFRQTISAAIEAAKDDYLVTIGIKPRHPETGYGYIKAGEPAGKAFIAERFVEKPDRETAEQYLQDGNYYWNAGIFVWKVSTIMSCFIKYMPGLYKTFSQLAGLDPKAIESGSGNARKITEDIFASIKPESIDYGIMEKAENKVVIPADFGWTDLGSWNSIDEMIEPDENNNRNTGTAPVYISSNNCSVFSEGKTIALVGVNDLVIAESGNNILIMNRNNSQEVRKVTEIIKKIKA